MRLVRRLILIGILLVLIPYLLTPLYATGQPVSTLMLWRWVTGAPVERTWVDLKDMSPALPRSVVGSEDAKFCTHRGIDWDSLQTAIEDAQDATALAEIKRIAVKQLRMIAVGVAEWHGQD